MFYFRCIFYTFYTNTGKMTKEEIYNKLQNYKSIDRIQLVRNDYKGTNEGFNEQLNNIINELQSDYDMKYYKRLNDLCMILDKAENENDLDRIKNIESQIESHEKTENNPFLISLKKEIENYIQQSETEQLESKGILTNETYYNLLENCTIEAFDSLKSKDLYPKNGTKAIWDISSLTITKGDGLPTDRDNELFRKEYILDNMRVTFLKALDRQYKDFENKHSIERDIFYKKCYQSILFKISNSTLWNEPDFGFNINKEPCKLTFIWNMRTEIEARSTETIKTITPEAPQQPKTKKPDEVKKEFKDFFNPDVKIETITIIQNEFKEYYGKKMAVLIYLLETEFKVILYSLDSKTDGRKHLVDSLNNSKPNMQPINKCFVTHSYKLDINNFENDKDFKNIKEKLLKTIK